MTTDEALQIVDNVGAATQMNRQGHIAFQEAVTTLRAALTEDVEDAPSPSRDGAREEVPAES